VTRQIALLAAGVAGVGLLLLASASGWLGGVIVCGADRAPGCIAWPAPIADLIWLAFLLGVAALAVWQFRYLDR
jgi:hypothetical protein